MASTLAIGGPMIAVLALLFRAREGTLVTRLRLWLEYSFSYTTSPGCWYGEQPVLLISEAMTSAVIFRRI